VKSKISVLLAAWTVWIP